jgi:ATP-binding cassette, subfamily G (WHITE), member 2, PDR
MVLAGLANTHLECSDVQLLHIDPPLGGPSNLTCAEYLGPFLQYTDGILKNPAAMTDCLYCPVNQTNILLQQLDFETEHVWSNVGYMVVYVIFNAFAIYFIYWLARIPKSSKKGK